jgi:hypothetical protein
MHETLIAPFDFPIYKSESELKSERDSVLLISGIISSMTDLLYDSVLAMHTVTILMNAMEVMLYITGRY